MFPELVADLHPLGQSALIAAAAAVWLMALRRVLREWRRPTATGGELARCGLPRSARPS